MFLLSSPSAEEFRHEIQKQSNEVGRRANSSSNSNNLRFHNEISLLVTHVRVYTHVSCDRGDDGFEK